MKSIYKKKCGLYRFQSILNEPWENISMDPLGSLGTKCNLDVFPVERRRKYYKGEGGGFPQVWDVVSLVSPRLTAVHPSTKNAQTMH
jgi:hypothetical protein